MSIPKVIYQFCKHYHKIHEIDKEKVTYFISSWKLIKTLFNKEGINYCNALFLSILGMIDVQKNSNHKFRCFNNIDIFQVF